MAPVSAVQEMLQIGPITAQVASSATGIVEAMSAFDRFLSAADVPASATWQMRVALDEVLSNIVRHAHPRGTKGVIDVRFALEGREIAVTVADDGEEYDPLAGPEPDLTSGIEDRQPGGLGVHLVKKLMDRVEYRRRDGRNWLVFARHL